MSLGPLEEPIDRVGLIGSKCWEHWPPPTWSFLRRRNGTKEEGANWVYLAGEESDPIFVRLNEQWRSGSDDWEVRIGAPLRECRHVVHPKRTPYIGPQRAEKLEP